MIDRSRHSSTLAFLDFLFNLVLAFVSLVILLLLIAKKEDSPKMPENKNEFIIQIQWDDYSDDDIDLWVMAPGEGNVVGYRHKEAPGLFLQQDDTGRANKKVQTSQGEVENPLNLEIVNINKIVEGRYTVNLHYYRHDSKRLVQDPESVVTVTVKVMKINPFKELPPIEVPIKRSAKGAEITAVNFTIDEEGKVVNTDTLPTFFVLDHLQSSSSSFD